MAVGVPLAVVMSGACVLPPKSAGEGHTEGAGATVGSTSTDAGASGAGSSTSPDATSVEAPPSSGDDAGVTCRDGIECQLGCLAGMASDLQGCTLPCGEGMTVDQALLFLQLTECVTDGCIDAGQCDGAGSSSTGEPGTSTSGTGSSPTDGSDADGSDSCSSCLLEGLTDPTPPGVCGPLAAMCT